eukprot:7303144-Prymnesium_polylepis.1
MRHAERARLGRCWARPVGSGSGAGAGSGGARGSLGETKRFASGLLHGLPIAQQLEAAAAGTRLREGVD